MKNGIITPFVCKPFNIHNITQLIALLKIKQKKYEKYKKDTNRKAHPSFFVAEKSVVDIDTIQQGFFEKKLLEKFALYKKEETNKLEEYFERFIREKKEEVQLLDFKIFFEGTDEDLLFAEPSVSTFKDELLFDIYKFIKNDQLDPIRFLQNSYLKHIEKCLKKHKKEFDENFIQEYTRVKYLDTDSRFSVYEGRILWAEVYVSFRTGKTENIKKLLRKFHTFFNGYNDSFGEHFLLYLEKQTEFPDVFQIKDGDDPFKKILLGIISGKVVNDPVVINSSEDYLYVLLVTKKPVDPKIFFDQRIKLLSSVLSLNFNEALRILFKTNFTIIARYFLLFELTRNSRFFSDNSSDPEYLENIRFFSIFAFEVFDKLSLYSHRVQFIVNLQDVPNYLQFLPSYIVKYNAIDIVKEPVILNEVKQGIIDNLLAGDKRKLMNIVQYLDSSMIYQFIDKVIEQAILTDQILPDKINLDSLKDPKLDAIKGFYYFNINPSITTLKKTIIADENTDLVVYKPIIEHLFSNAAKVAIASRDKKICKTLFDLCGILQLSEKCSDLATSELLLYV